MTSQSLTAGTLADKGEERLFEAAGLPQRHASSINPPPSGKDGAAFPAPLKHDLLMKYGAPYAYHMEAFSDIETRCMRRGQDSFCT